MRYWVAGLALLLPLPAVADEVRLADVSVSERVVRPKPYRSSEIHTTVRRVSCVNCGGGLPWGGLRPVRKAQLPWGGLPDSCPPAVSRSVVVVTKG